MSAPNALPRPAAFAILLVAVLITYFPAFSCDFVSWDDYETIARNPALHPPTPASIASFWTRPQGDLYIPVTYTVWALVADMTAPQTSPALFHTLNVALHVAAAWFAYLLLLEVTGASLPSLLGALLFALHPVQVESVTWASGTKDVLYAMLSLLALWQYLKFVRDGARAPFVLATVAFALALLSKPTTIVVPLMAAAFDYAVVKRPIASIFKSAGLWLLLAIPIVVVTELVQAAQHAHELSPLWARPLVALDALAFYLFKLVWPAKLTIDYGRTPAVAIEHGWLFWTWIAPVALASVLLVYRRRAAMLVVAAILFFAPLLPVLGLVPFDFQAYSTVADHYLYLAMLGPALAFAWLVSRDRPGSLLWIVVVVLVALAIRSSLQIRHWRDSHALFHHALAVNSRSFAAYNSLAAAAVDAGDFPTAIRLAKQAIELRPEYAGAYLTLADALRRQGDVAGAIQRYQQALAYEPKYAPALNNLAALLAEQGHLADAIPIAQKGVAADPSSVQAHLNLGRMYFQSGQWDLARLQFETVLHLDPANAPARELLSELRNTPSP